MLRVPIGGHSNADGTPLPRGLEAEMIASGWPGKADAVTKAIQRFKPSGLVINNPFGEVPGTPMDLGARDACFADPRTRIVADLDAFQTTIGDWSDALRVFGRDADPLVGIYLGATFDWKTMTLRQCANAWSEALNPLDPAYCYPIFDAMAGGPRELVSMVLNTVFAEGFQRCGYEPTPLLTTEIDQDDDRLVCYCAGEWWHTRGSGFINDPRRVPRAHMKHRMIVQAEQGYGSPDQVSRVIRDKGTPALDFYMIDQYVQFMPAPVDRE